METNFLPSGNHFSSILRYSCYCTSLFPSSGNVFLNESCISVSGNGVSGEWKQFFNLLFRHLCQWQFFSRLVGTNESFILPSGNEFSGQWKPVNTFYQQKKTQNKAILHSVDKKLVSITRNQELTEKYVPVKE